MPTFTCPECHFERETLAPSGVCFICTEKTEATRLVEADVATVTRELPDTITHGSPDGEWAGALPPGGYRYDDKPIGEGGMGVVWRAVRVSTGQTFAIKKLKPDSLTPTGIRRFVAEARSLATIEHDHVVRLSDFVPDPADPFLVLEYVPGVSLAEHLREVGPLHPVRAARMIAEAARGVDAAHRVGIVHRDLKPGNLLLTLAWRVKVADFGLCKVMAEADVPVPAGAVGSGGDGNTPQGGGTLTAPGRLAGGTPGFMAPEQVSEEFGQVSPVTDVFGLGACLHAALTAQAPFPTGKPHMGMVLTDAPTPTHEAALGVPVELSAIVAKCLQKDQCLRYESAAAVAADLTRYLAGEGTSVRPHSPPVRLWRQARQANRGAVMGIAVAVIAVAVGIGLAMASTRDPEKGQQAQLQSKKEVVLVADGRPPAKPNFVFGEAVISPPTGADPEFSFASRGTTALALARDPGVDRYRITAELRQLPPTPADQGPGGASLGIFWAYRQSEFPDGVKARAWMTLAFSDRPTTAERKAQMGFIQVGQFESATDFPDPQNSPGPMTEIDTVTTLPGPWRLLVVDVTPGKVVAHLPTGTKELTADAIATKYDKITDRLKVKSGGRTLGTREWSPRSPVGVFVEGGRVAVRSFTLSPIPE